MLDKPLINQYNPDTVSSPGETLAELLGLHNMSQAQLAERTGRPKKTINEIIKGKSAITPETALQFEKVFGVAASFWNNRDRRYREFLAKRAELKTLRSQTSWLDEIPFRELVKLGWVQDSSDKLRRLELLLAFFGVAGPKQWRDLYAGVSFRKSPAFRSNPGAIAAWLRKGELEATEIECDEFDASKFRATLDGIRKEEIIRLRQEGPANVVKRMVERCSKSGTALVFVRSISHTRTFGASRWLSPNKALIQISLLYKNDYSLWFTFFHEAGHILRHGKKSTFINFENMVEDALEKEANSFAEEILFPNRSLQAFAESHPDKRFSTNDILRFAENQSLTPGVVVGKLQHAKTLPRTHFNKLRLWFKWT